MRTVLCGALLAALLAGCAPAPVRMSEADRSAVKAVALSKDVAKPPEPFYLGPGGAVGLMFGALGAAATEPGRQNARAALQEFVEKYGVSIERIVREEVDAALRASGKLAVSEDASGATIRITIAQYGLSIPNGFSSNLVPVLTVTCQMVDAAGKVLWSASDRIGTLGNPVEGVPAEQMRGDPKAIEAAWRAAARHVSANIVKDL